MTGTPSGKGCPSSAKRRNLSVVRSVVKQKIAAGKYHGDFHFGGPEEDRTPEPFGCEPNAIPAELRAHIGHFSSKKVMKNGFLRYSILRGKSEKPDRKLEGKIGLLNWKGTGAVGCASIWMRKGI